MKFIYKNKKINFFTLGLAIACLTSLGVLVHSCNNEYDSFESIDSLDSEIVNAPELEEYIIAGTDFYKSLEVFRKELNKIDFSTLEVTYDAEGRKMIHLPLVLVGNVKIGEKIQIFNEKKEALQKKFPQFVSFRKKVGEKYFQQCIQNSVNVKGKFLEMGINVSRPKLKDGSEDAWGYWDENSFSIFYQLHYWVQDPNYVEVTRYIYYDDWFYSY